MSQATLGSSAFTDGAGIRQNSDWRDAVELNGSAAARVSTGFRLTTLSAEV